MKLISSELQQEIWYTIRSNKRRTLFTALGVFVGMFFFTLLTGLGTGTRNAIDLALEGTSSEQLFAFTGRTTLPYEGYKANREIAITYNDYEELKATTQNLDLVCCMTGWSSNGPFSDMDVVSNGKSRKVFVAGITENYADLNTIITVEGRNLRSDEIEAGEPNCVIGESIVDKFYSTAADAIGKYINVGGIAFRIVGVVKPFSDSFQTGFNIGWSIQLPISYALKSDPTTSVMLSVIPKPGITAKMAEADIFRVVSKNHHIDPRDKDVVQTIGMEIFLEIFGMIQSILDILIWVIGLGTLFTGVISVSNILLVTVRERQREIGVRRALGAKPEDIRDQFMLEALFIILLAGVAGLLSGLSLTLIIGSIAERSPGMSSYLLRPYPQLWVLIFSIIVMVLSGILAGLLPVYKALQIKAIDAIRDE